MDIDEFTNTLNEPEPPEFLNPWMKALWLDANDRWHDAHAEIQDLPDKASAWIHAYLHRREGDIFNADYWYRRAGKDRPSVSLAEEWEGLLSELIEKSYSS